ncbi:hypothetical protein HanIR_Chr17g0875891 [Helianthus annuus]|nr:hypothetical protein HanIR_Chr17g0875891 [Helianthus annuus]
MMLGGFQVFLCFVEFISFGTWGKYGDWNSLDFCCEAASSSMPNAAGTLAAILGTVGAGFFVELVSSFQGFLLLTSLLYFWNIFSTGERVNFDEGS